MECLSEERLEAWLADRLEADERALCAEHLEGCQRCRDELEDTQRDQALFSELKQAVKGNEAQPAHWVSATLRISWFKR